MTIPFVEEVLSEHVGEHVFVYFNLHKECWSIKSLLTNRVMLHCNTVTLRDATFRVSEPGRQRVHTEGRKNVHAGIQGYIVHYSDYSGHFGGGHGIRYNPYDFHTFVTTEGDVPMYGAKFVSLMACSSCKVMAKNIVSIAKHLEMQKVKCPDKPKYASESYALAVEKRDVTVDDIIRQLEKIMP